MPFEAEKLLLSTWDQGGESNQPSPQGRKTRNGRRGGERDAETEASSKHWLMAADGKEVYATALCTLSSACGVWINTRGVELGRKPCDMMESDKLQFGLGVWCRHSESAHPGCSKPSVWSHCRKLSIMAHAYISGIEEVEAGGSQVHGHSWPMTSLMLA